MIFKYIFHILFFKITSSIMLRCNFDKNNICNTFSIINNNIINNQKIHYYDKHDFHNSQLYDSIFKSYKLIKNDENIKILDINNLLNQNKNNIKKKLSKNIIFEKNDQIIFNIKNTDSLYIETYQKNFYYEICDFLTIINSNQLFLKDYYLKVQNFIFLNFHNIKLLPNNEKSRISNIFLTKNIHLFNNIFSPNNEKFRMINYILS